MITTRIESHSHFCDLVEEFDLKYGTNTFIGHDTLKNINKYFPLWESRKRNDELQVHEKIERNIIRGFTSRNRTVFTNQDYYPRTEDAFELFFFNGIYLLLDGIKNGEGLYGPIAVSRFSNKRSLVHPGSHRIALMNIYHKDVTYIVTDYNNKDLSKGKWFGKLYKPRDTDFNWRKGRWKMRDTDYIPIFQKSDAAETRYKDIIDGNVDKDKNSWHRPETANRIYRLVDDTVFVDNIPVCIKEDHIWKIVPV